MNVTTLAEQIDTLLPQTQCGQCGYSGCKPYAQAIANGIADIDQCPPGGDVGIAELAELLGVPVKPLNTAFGIHKPTQMAFINEAECIGCVKCIAACPVDAIIGAAKFMHTVIVAECTGCELCVAPCPVDCIDMVPVLGQATNAHKDAQKALAKRRYEARNLRKNIAAAEKTERMRKQKADLLGQHP